MHIGTREGYALVLGLLGIIGIGCAIRPEPRSADFSHRTIRIVTTTSIITDLVERVGGERVEVEGLMGPGVDPHLYKASEGDVRRMGQADVIFYNGLHLEGKMTEVFEQMEQRQIPTFALANGLNPTQYRASANFPGNYDPHLWFDVQRWQAVARYVANTLSTLDPTHQETYQSHVRTYLAELDSLDIWVRAQIATLPPERRVLITSHDAFGYFGEAYGVEVHGLQGISTAADAGTADVQRLVDLIVTRQLPAIFVESSVPPRGIEAVKAAVAAKGGTVQIGGHLFSDALGSPGKPEGTYAGMIRHNVHTLVSGLGATSPILAP
jgi:manganese/zinc/iron transport system substrate-binding protein